MRYFWKSDWFLGLLLTLLFCFAYVINFSPLKSLELSAYDAAISASQVPADAQIVIIDIDNASIERLGRWPWPRSTIAHMISLLTDASARLIGIDIFFSEKQESTRNSQVSLQLAKLLRQQGKVEEAKKIESDALSMDNDHLLVSSVRKNNNVYMPMFFDIGIPLGQLNNTVKPFIERASIKNISSSDELANPIHAVKLHFPFDDLANATAGVGFLNVILDSDGVLRTEPLVVEYYEKFFPSLSLAMAASALNVSMDDIRVNLGKSLEMGGIEIASDSKMRMYPTFHSDSKGRAFRHYSFHEVLSGEFPISLFKDKIVLIGVTGSGLGETYVTPVDNYMSGVDFQAHVLQSILDESFYTQPAWTSAAELSLILLIGAFLIFLLPRISVATGIIISLLLLSVLWSINYFMLVNLAIWVQTITAAVLLLVGYLCLTAKRHFASEGAREKISADSAETNKMLGLAFQGQGLLDMAFDKFRKCPATDDVLQCLYNLALDFERKRQFNKATSIYEHIAEHDKDYKDVSNRMEHMKVVDSTVILGGTMGTNAMSSLLTLGGTNPTLGRYEIIRELGKGAMGIVYLGKDPKINREVAIKTMALAQEFEPDEMEEVKERFFKEAETAGMLNHPNIVTIFDAGDEHDLAYIAMEFLDGTDLAPYTKKGKLFPANTTMKICGKVAEALHYAQSQHVVHRDIKPANIMLLKNKKIKVTDFGIARITASSKTKTGVILGTPSYMSPEQLSGMHVDGRSDIFSLGVMMYEMLSGMRPFRGDSMATLMFQIANMPHPDIREHNSNISERTAKLIDSMLAKDVDARIPNGAAVIKEIIQCLRR